MNIRDLLHRAVKADMPIIPDSEKQISPQALAYVYWHVRSPLDSHVSNVHTFYRNVIIFRTT
jgi:hypothetical protein